MRPEAFCIRAEDYSPGVDALSCPLVAEVLLHGDWSCSKWGPWNYSECEDDTVRISWYGDYGETRYDLVFDGGGSLAYARGSGYVSQGICSTDLPAGVIAGRPPPASVACRTCSLCGGAIDEGFGGGPGVERCDLDEEGRVSLPD